MKKIECVIADDEALSRDILRTYIGQTPSLHLAAECRNGLEVFEVLKTTAVDLLFLDIQMPMLTGIELLKTMEHPPKVIIVTAYREFALEGYELNVMDYLLKPIAFPRFLKAIGKYHNPVAVNTPQAPAFIDIRSDKKTTRVPLDTIILLEGMKDYVRILTDNGQLITHQTLQSLEDELSAHNFIRVHRSYIISAKKVTAFSPSFVELAGKQIPMGTFYQRTALERLSNY